MTREATPASHRSVVRYCYAIVGVAGVSALILAGAVLGRHQAEIEERARIEGFHLRSLSLSNECSGRIGRLEGILKHPTPAAPGSLPHSPTTQDRNVAVGLASIEQTLDSILLLHEGSEHTEFNRPLQRLRDRHTQLQASLATEDVAEDVVWAGLDALAFAMRQFHQLHSVELERDLEEMALAAETRARRLAGFIVAVLLVTGGLVFRLLQLIRSRLREHLRTERALQDRERQLQHGQKIQALGTLVGGVAHDFNNILTVILGRAQVLRLRLEDGSPDLDDADEIVKAGERAANLIRQLLAFSRYEMVEPGFVDVNLSLQDMETRMRRLIREDIQFSLQLGDDLGMANIDHVQLEQILVNLITNACHAMPHGGGLTILTSNVSLKPAEAEGLALPPGRYTRVRVADTGTGMTQEVVARVFEPFFSTKSRERGTGLGLSTVHGIVTGVGGQVRIDSEVDRGTRFDVYLPSTAAQAESPADASSQHEGLSGTETILLVEDDDQVRDLAQNGLRSAGYRVLACSDGAEALRVYRENAEDIQLILTDVVLPGPHGPAVVEQIRGICPGLAAVYMSGYTDETLLNRVRATEDPLVPKPFRLQELLKVVREQMDRQTTREIASA